jgi:hypothetical protein
LGRPSFTVPLVAQHLDDRRGPSDTSAMAVGLIVAAVVAIFAATWWSMRDLGD